MQLTCATIQVLQIHTSQQWPRNEDRKTWRSPIRETIHHHIMSFKCSTSGAVKSGARTKIEEKIIFTLTLGTTLLYLLTSGSLTLPMCHIPCDIKSYMWPCSDIHCTHYPTYLSLLPQITARLSTWDPCPSSIPLGSQNTKTNILHPLSQKQLYNGTNSVYSFVSTHTHACIAPNYLCTVT